MKHLKNLLSIAEERVRIKKEIAEEESLNTKEEWTEVAFIFDYLLSNIDDFKNKVNQLEEEDYEKVDRVIQETAKNSDYEFVFEFVKNFLDEEVKKS